MQERFPLIVFGFTLGLLAAQFLNAINGQSPTVWLFTLISALIPIHIWRRHIATS